MKRFFLVLIFVLFIGSVLGLAACTPQEDEIKVARQQRVQDVDAVRRWNLTQFTSVYEFSPKSDPNANCVSIEKTDGVALQCWKK